jgi:hypothetical protein
MAIIVDPYSEVRLLEVRAGRRFWQSEFFANNRAEFYEQVVKPLRQLQNRGVLEKLEEITGQNESTPRAVEIVGCVKLPT